jgi:gamma-glutamyl-gamma-aminobutyrate hydrolase PuuD
MTVPLIAVTGRRMGARVDRWPHPFATVSPRAYLDAVTRAGGRGVVVDPYGDSGGLLERFDALVLTGGPDLDPTTFGQVPHPKTYGVDRHVDDFEIPLVRDAISRGTPTLAICRGFQVCNVALGGSLYQHIPDDPGTEPHGRPGEPGGGRLHDVTIDAGSRLASVMGATTVTASCHHHQAVDKVGDGLHVVARAADGIVEAIELDHPEQWLLAVQWHPEDTAATDAAQQNLFDALVAQTR